MNRSPVLADLNHLTHKTGEGTRMKTIIGKITIDILTSIYQPFWFAILLSTMTMFFYLYVKCPEGAGKG